MKVCLLQVLLLFFTHVCLNTGQQQSGPYPDGIPATVYSSPDSSGFTCPSQDTINEEHRRVRDSILDYYNTELRCSCGGPGGWTRIAYLNMSDTNQQCPSNWTLTTSPVRGCGRLDGYDECSTVIYPVNGRTYSSVCGRILAYHRGNAYGLHNALLYGNNLDQPYLSGVSLTHGPTGSRTHIWSFVGAMTESSSTDPLNNCPCTNINITWPYEFPLYINNDYFCDTGNTRAFDDDSMYYTDDPLWDGEGCGPTSTCCSLNSPPWFCKSLPQPTSDDLEIRLCGYNTNRHDDKIIHQLGIFVK